MFCGAVLKPVRPAVTRKTDSTDPHSRWRDAPISPPVGKSCKQDHPPASPPVTRSAAIRQGSETRAAVLPAAVPAASGGNPSGHSNLADARGPEVDSEVVVDEVAMGFFARLCSQRNSSWLVSLIIHLTLLIVLALLTFRLNGTQRGILIEGAVSQSGDRDQLPSVEMVPQATNPDIRSKDVPTAVKIPQPSDVVASSNVVAPNAPSPIDQSLSAEMALGGGTATSKRNLYLDGGGMSARTPEGRKANGDRYGATVASETAVENALRWLVNHQRSDGSWSFDLRLAPCEGRCGNGRMANSESPTPAAAATGLALLAFLGAGYTSEVGPYQEEVSRGLYYLRSAAVETEFGYDWQQGGSMYGHGIALMAVSEALGMTKRDERYDSDLLHYAHKGAAFTEIAQHDNGSWGYTPGSPGDTTLSGWQILSLVGARKAGVQLRSTTFPKAKSFLMSVRAQPEFQFGYRSPKAEPTTTAIALTLLMYLGQQPGHSLFDRAIDKLATDGPTLTNVYHDYYATMALHHYRHRDWEAWNTKLRDHLVRNQETEGHEAGSWHFKDRWGDIGGRVYTTAMCALTLEVYYRYLPLYDDPPDFPL